MPSCYSWRSGELTLQYAFVLEGKSPVSICPVTTRENELMSPIEHARAPPALQFPRPRLTPGAKRGPSPTNDPYNTLCTRFRGEMPEGGKCGRWEFESFKGQLTTTLRNQGSLQVIIDGVCYVNSINDARSRR